ncbi:hypothetical protein HIM_06719 [Hirsutella minnesotensis 3608]|uniref:DUF7357 domain-containing protein n=1 Tax=Hirsutella minnesotensis 3608 TaxID=1043627 RepID=A0A0F7ZIL9_9HYPO|nr:hypothetical protein HIM_06719 [Hirsutella minnesotensis 3608]
MASDPLRLRLSVRRNGVPEVKLVWPCERSQDLTVSKLLGQLNDVLPLECGEWGLEDYVVELADGTGGSFECLHFQQVQHVFKNDDLVSIRCLQGDDLRRRRLSGRHQITVDGKHLIDGLVFGKAWTRAPRDRPAVELPPRKRARESDDGADDEDDDEEPAARRPRLLPESEYVSDDSDSYEAQDDEPDEREVASELQALIKDNEAIGEGELLQDDEGIEAAEAEAEEPASGLPQIFSAFLESMGVGASDAADEDEAGPARPLIEVVESEEGRERPDSASDSTSSDASSSDSPFSSPSKSSSSGSSSESDSDQPGGAGGGDLGNSPVHGHGNKHDHDPNNNGPRDQDSDSNSDSDSDSDSDTYSDSGSSNASDTSAGALISHRYQGAIQRGRREDFEFKVPLPPHLGLTRRHVPKAVREKCNQPRQISPPVDSAPNTNTTRDLSQAEQSAASSSEADSPPAPISSRIDQAAQVARSNHMPSAANAPVPPYCGLSRTQKRNARRRRNRTVNKHSETAMQSLMAALAERKREMQAAKTLENNNAAVNSENQVGDNQVGDNQASDTPARQKQFDGKQTLGKRSSGSMSPGPPDEQGVPDQDQGSHINHNQGDDQIHDESHGQESVRKRARLDMGAGRRLVFGALGLKTPKCKADEDEIRNSLMKGVRALNNPRISKDEDIEMSSEQGTKISSVQDIKMSSVQDLEVSFGQDADMPPEQGLHMSYVQDIEMLSLDSDDLQFEHVGDEERPAALMPYSGEECCTEDVPLMEPPFPFTQRWDPQQQGRQKRKRNRKSQEFYDDYNEEDSGLYVDENAVPPREWEVVKGDPFTDGLTDEQRVEIEVMQAFAAEFGDDETAEDDKGEDTDGIEALADAILEHVAPLPQDVSVLPQLAPEDLMEGMLITWQEMGMSVSEEAWGPTILRRTGVLLTERAQRPIVVKVAHRDRESIETQCTFLSRKVDLDKFDGPTRESDDDDDDGLRVFDAWDELRDLRLLQMPPGEPLDHDDDGDS